MNEKFANFLFKHKAQFTMCFILLLFSSALSGQTNPYIDSLSTVLSTTPASCEKVTILAKLARAYIRLNIEVADEYSREGIKIGKAKNCNQELGELYNTTSVIHFYKGDNQKAFQYIDSSIDILTRLNYKKGLAAAVGNKGIFYASMGNYTESLKFHYQCLRLNEDLNNKNGIATTLTNIFTVLLEQKDYKRALETALHAYNLFDELGDKDGMAMTSYNIAFMYSKLDQIDSCLYFVNLSENLFAELAHPEGIADAYRLKAGTFQKQNKLNEALDLLYKAMVIYDSIGHKFKKVELYELLSSVYYDMKDFDKSISVALELMTEARLMEAKQLERDAAKLLMQNYLVKGDYKKAFEFSDLYHSLKDEMLNESTLNEIGRIRSEYELERSTLELESLGRHTQILQLKLYKKNIILVGGLILTFLVVTLAVVILKQKKTTVERRAIELEQKALRAQMNPHFLFNALSSIQRMYVEGNEDTANDFMSDFASLMRKILENSNQNKINLHDELSTLELYLRLEKLRCKDVFDYTIEVHESIDQYSLKVAPLILQPFVENAIWHGILPMNKKGHITISITEHGNRLKFCIHDNGIGISQDRNSTHESKGMQITEQRIGNKINIESLKNEGTTIAFYIDKRYD